MGVREELFAAVQARMERVAAAQDLSVVLEPGALAEARQLTEMIERDAGDLEARYILGWLHWFRCEALPQAQGRQDLDAAIGMFTPCFIAGMEGLPETLLPTLAEQAVPSATLLFQQAFRSGRRDLISATVDLWQRIVSATPADHPHWAVYMSRLGIALWRRFELSGPLVDLDAAIAALEAAVEATPAEHADRAGYLANLGNVLKARFGRTGELADLDAAIATLRAAAEALPGRRPEQETLLPQLGNALWLRFERTAALADLDSAIATLEALVQASSASDHRYRAMELSNLGNALRTRFERTGVLSDLDTAIEVSRAAVKASTADPNRAMYWSNLGAALRLRFERTGVLADLDTAIEVNRAAVEATPADHADWPGRINNLADALRARFERTGALPDLDLAIEVGRAGVEATPSDHADRAGRVNNLADALRARFERTAALADLDGAIAALETAVEVTPIDHPNRPLRLSNLGNALRARFERTGVLTDLDAAIDAGRAAVEASPADHPQMAMFLSNLGNALRLRSEHTGMKADLDTAVEVGQAAVEASPTDPNRATYLSNLGIALQTRFGRTGRQDDLDAAIGALEAAVEASPADYPNRQGMLANLGNVLRTRFERTGTLVDLDTAIAVLEAAAEATPTDYPNRAGRMSNLGDALRLRFERTGALADLDAAIAILEAAVKATPTDHPSRPERLSEWGIALRLRFERTGASENLDEAIEAAQAAVDSTRADHPGRAMYQNNLGNALRARFDYAGAPADLNAAIATIEAAVKAVPAERPDRGMYLSNLGGALWTRFERRGAQLDLDAAIAALEAAVEATPADHPNQAMYLFNLGRALRTRFEHTGALTDREAAAAGYVRAAELGSAAPSVRIRAARAAAALMAGSDPTRAADLLETAVRLLPEVTPRRLDRSDQQYAISGFARLAGDAAALVLANTSADMTGGEPAERAVRLLEAGRAVLLSQALAARDDLADLRQHHPDLAAQFEELRDTLDQHGDTAAALTDPIGTDLITRAGHTTEDRRQLADDLAATLTRIRALDGFATFGLPPTADELVAQAASGPVVSVNVSEHRSDALLLTRDGIISLELPGLALDPLIGQINSFHQALYTTANPSMSSRARRDAQATLSGVLEWLWDAAAEPVLSALGYHGAPTPGMQWPRVWWAPGGLLGLLPIHAAGYHAERADDQGRRTVIDRVVSSYTPTIRALRYARQHATHAEEPSRALIVAMPTTPGVPGRLDHVPAEVTMLYGRLPSPVLLAEPGTLGADPSLAPEGAPAKANVLAHLPGCQIAHFACHGASNPADPSKSLLLLHDHSTDPFTVASLAPVKLDRAELAYLSACRTAFTGAAGLLDEAIHLTSAFQLAGFSHVVGTLWEINDAIAVTIAETFYAGLRGAEGKLDPSRAAHALHHAVRTARDNLPVTPSLWAAYMHAGA